MCLSVCLSVCFKHKNQLCWPSHLKCHQIIRVHLADLDTDSVFHCKSTIHLSRLTMVEWLQLHFAMSRNRRMQFMTSVFHAVQVHFDQKYRYIYLFLMKQGKLCLA